MAAARSRAFPAYSQFYSRQHIVFFIEGKGGDAMAADQAEAFPTFVVAGRSWLEPH